MQDRSLQPSETTFSDFHNLLQRAQNGDNDALSKLMEQYRDYLLLLANQRMPSELRSKFGASDIVQQSMLAIHQQLPQFRGTSEAEFKGWVRAIVQNHLLNTKRSYKATQRRQTDQEVRLAASDNGHSDLRDPDRTPQAAALLKELASELELALGQLSEPHQQVLRLRNWREMSFGEIGQQMSCSADAARKLWFRAFQNLQRIIKQTRPEFASHLTAFSHHYPNGQAENE